MDPVSTPVVPAGTLAPAASGAGAGTAAITTLAIPRLALHTATGDTPPHKLLMDSRGSKPVGVLQLNLDLIRSAGLTRGAAFIRPIEEESESDTDSVYSDAESIDLDAEPCLCADEGTITRRRSSFLERGFGIVSPSKDLHEVIIMIERYYSEKARATARESFVFFQSEAPFVPTEGDTPPLKQWENRVLAHLASLLPIHTVESIQELLGMICSLPASDTVSEKLTHAIPTAVGSGLAEKLTYHVFKLPNGGVIIFENVRFASGSYKRVYQGFYIHPSGEVEKKAVTIGQTILKEAQFIIEHRIDHPNMIKAPIACFKYKSEEYGIWDLYPKDMVGVIADILKKDVLEIKDLKRIILITRDTLNGIAYLFSINNLHLDIKPSNIFIKADGGAVIADLGLVMNVMEAAALRRELMLQTEMRYSLEGRRIPPVFDFDRGEILFSPLADYMSSHRTYPSYEKFKSWMEQKVAEGVFSSDETSETNPMVLSVKDFLEEVKISIGGIKVRGTEYFMPASARHEGIIDDTNDCYAVGEMLKTTLAHAKFMTLIATLGVGVVDLVNGLIKHLIESADLEKRGTETSAMAAREPAFVKGLRLVEELLATLDAASA